jgi:carbonic anhydrase/acetyltransferase-like protein (isoleucine patch superfamily)
VYPTISTPVADALTTLRRSLGRARVAVQDVAPVRATVGRTVDGQVPPPPRAFARFGDGSWIVPAALVRNPHRIAVGAGAVILEHSTLLVLDDANSAEPALTIGDGVRLARCNTIVCGSAEIVLGDGVASSDAATILGTWRDGLRPWATLAGLPLPNDAPVIVGKGAYLGCNSVVWPGVVIGDGAYVGEGAVVVEDVPARSVVYGNPATVVRSYVVRDAWRRP